MRLLTAVLLLTYSLLGWASSYPDDYDKIIIHNKGDIIKAEDFNNNNNIHKQNIIKLNNNIVDLQESISTIEAGTGPQGPQGEQGPAGPQGEQGPAGNDGVVNGVTCQTNQIVRYNGSAWVCADDVLATLDCDEGDRLVRGANGWECSNSYSVSGNLTGMDAGNSVGLTLNGVSLTMNGNGQFTFPNEVEAGQTYTVQVQTQPSNGTETCEVTANGSGNMLAPITDVAVHCYPSAFARAEDFSDSQYTGVHSHFDTFSPNVADKYCGQSGCEFTLTNVTDHTECSLKATNYLYEDYQVSITRESGYILISDSESVFGNGSVIVEILCPQQ